MGMTHQRDGQKDRPDCGLLHERVGEHFADEHAQKLEKGRFSGCHCFVISLSLSYLAFRSELGGLRMAKDLKLFSALMGETARRNDRTTSNLTISKCLGLSIRVMCFTQLL